MDSARVPTSARAADQLLVSDSVIKLELSSKSKKALNSNSNLILPFVGAPEVNQASYNAPLTSSSSSSSSSSVNSPYPNLNLVNPAISTEACPVANYNVGSLRYSENVNKDHPGVYCSKPANESKPVLPDIGFISDLVPRKHELRSNSLEGKESQRSTGLATPPTIGADRDGRRYGNSCTFSDLPSGSTEADFGIVKEELNIDDIEEGAEYSCLASHSSVPESLFSGILPDVIEPFMKGTESESLLKTDVSMNENVTQENVPQMLDLLNKPATKPIRRQRVKKTPKLGARLSSVISKLAQSKETLILSKSNPSNLSDSRAQQNVTSKTSSENPCGGSSSVQSDASARLSVNTAPFRTTVQNVNNAQVLSATTNQCLENSVKNKCDETPQPLTTSISATPDSLDGNKSSLVVDRLKRLGTTATPDSLDGTKSSLVVDRLKRLGTSIVVENSSTDAFESNAVRRPPVESNKIETSITIESQPYVSTRSLSQSVPPIKVPSPKSKSSKKTAKLSSEPAVSVTPAPAVVPEPFSVKPQSVKVSISLEKAVPTERNHSNSTQNQSTGLGDDLSSPQYKKCLNMLESLVKADDIVQDIAKNCVKNKTNRKINKNVLKYDSKLSKNNWKSNLVSNDSSPPKTTLIINKTIPLKTKIKITHSCIDDTSSAAVQVEPILNETKSIENSQKIDGEIVKIIMDKHSFTIGDSSIIEMPNGQKMYTCDVCSGVYQKGFSLKRHYLRSHINYHFIQVKESEANYQNLTMQLSGGPDDNGGMDPTKVLLFRCHVCGNCFPYKSELKEHLMAHPPVNSISNNDTKVYKCINCSSVFNRKKEFSKHRKTCVIEVPAPLSNIAAAKQRLNEKLLCLFCAKVFPSVAERKKHGLKVHHWKKKIHPCFKCPETFQFQTLVYQHLREIHRNDYFSCAPCKERFLNDIQLQAHCSQKHNGNIESMAVINDKSGSFEFFDEEPPELWCNTCSKIFSSQTNLNKHMKTMHLTDEKPSLAAKHVIVLSKSPSLSGKDTKDSKMKSLEAKSKSTSKTKSDPKIKDSDTVFYSELSDNIQFNLMHHIDGKLLSEKTKKDSMSPLTEASVVSNQSATSSKVGNGDLLSKTPPCLSQLDLVGKSTCGKGVPTSLQSEEKPKTADSALNYTEDMSHLDIATQLTMKRNLHILNSTKSRAKSEGDTTHICGNIRLKRVKDLSKDLSLERPETLCAESFGDNSFETMDSNLGLSGFWVRPHNYVCTTCGSQSLNFWDMEDHKWNHHPNVKGSHYEFSENHLPGWEFFTSRTFESQGVIEPEENPEVPSTGNNRSRCSKCRKNCGSLLELHRHMLECGLDTTWMLTLMPSPSKKSKDKKKWRPFGSRRRRLSRVRGLKRNIPNSPMKIIFPPKLNPKSKSGDTESIQKMIANLPAKRATRRVVIFDNVSRAGQATINSVPITNPNWNNNTYEDGLIENLLKNDEQGVPLTSNASNAATDAATTNTENKERAERSSCVTDFLLANSTVGTRIVPIWPPAEQSDVLTSLGMMPIPQIPLKLEPPKPVIVSKVPDPESFKPLVPESPVKTVKPVKMKILRSVVRQLSASSLESSDSGKKTDKSEKSSASSSRSASPKVIEAPIKSSPTDKLFGKITSSPTSPSKVFSVLPISSVKKPCDLATEKSTILDAMRIAMASSALTDSVFSSKSTKTRKMLKKSLSESLLIGKDSSFKTETVVDDKLFSCSRCTKVFKSGAVLKRHQVRCSGNKPSEELANVPELMPPLDRLKSEETGMTKSKTKISSPSIMAGFNEVKENSILTSKSDTDASLSDQPSEIETSTSVTTRAKKTALKETVQVSEPVAEGGGFLLRLRSKTAASSDVGTGISVEGETKVKEKLASSKEDLMPILEPETLLPESSDASTQSNQGSNKKLRKKVSIFQRTDKPKRDNNKAISEASKVSHDKQVDENVEKQSVVGLECASEFIDVVNIDDLPGSKDNLTPRPDSSKKDFDDMSSDSDSDSTPLVQLKEILKTSLPTHGKNAKRKVLVRKQKITKRRVAKQVRNLTKPQVKEVVEIKPEAGTTEVFNAPEAETKFVKRVLRSVEAKPVENRSLAADENSSKPPIKKSAEDQSEGESPALKFETPGPSSSERKKVKQNLRPEMLQNNRNSNQLLVKESKDLKLVDSSKVSNEALSSKACDLPTTGRKKVKRSLRQVEGKAGKEISIVDEPKSSIEPLQQIDEACDEKPETVSISSSSKQMDTILKMAQKKKRRKAKRLNSKCLKNGQWKKGRKAFNTRKNPVQTNNGVNSSQDSVAEMEDPLKNEIDLDDSFRLCLSEDEKDEAKKMLLVESDATSKKVDSDTETTVKDELATNRTSETTADETSKNDSKPAQTSEETPPKPKRKRCSAYNLLFTHLKQEDMHELLTTIQADRQNLKRKCTLIDAQQAVDKKPRKIVGKTQSEGDNSQKVDSEEKEAPQTAENVDPQPAETTENVDSCASVGDKKDTKKAGDGKTVKKVVRVATKAQTSKLRSRNMADDEKHQTQTTLDVYIAPKKLTSDAEIAKDTGNSVEEPTKAVSSNIKTKQKQSTLDEWSNAGTNQSVSASTVEQQQPLATNSKNKTQKPGTVDKKSGLNDETSGSDFKSTSRAKLRSSANLQDEKIVEIVEEILDKTSKPVLASSRTRAKKSSQTVLTDAVSDVPLSVPEVSDTKSANLLSKVDGDSALLKENVFNNDAKASLSKNSGSNAKTPVHTENVVLNSELSNNSTSKKRKRAKKNIVKDTISEVTSDDDNLPLSSLSEENIASSLSQINSDDTELSGFKPKGKKVCKQVSTNSFDSADVEDTMGSDIESENCSEKFSPLVAVKNKSKTLKRKRKKSLLQKNLLNNIDSPMTSDSEASILRVCKKQLKGKKSHLLSIETSSNVEDNSVLVNNLALHKQIAKLKKTKKLKKVLSLINSGGKSVTESIEASDVSVAENSQSNESLSSSAIDRFRKKKLKKKKSKKKRKNLKDKDLVNVLVQTVAKTAKIWTKKSSEQLLRKKQLKLQRKKALKVLSHVNNDWKISIVNQESNDNLTTEIPDSSNDLEENKKEIESSSINSSQTLASDDTDSNQSVDKSNKKKFYCSLCDKDCHSLVTLNKHFLTWKHRYNKKILTQQEPCDTLKVSSFLNSPSFESTQISLNSLKSKLTSATKASEAPVKVSEPSMAVSNVGMSVSSDMPRVFTSSMLMPIQSAPVSVEPLEPVIEPNWSQQEWSSQGWQSIPAPAAAPVNSWLHDPWTNTNSYESAPSLGSILDSVNQILADPAAADPHADPVSQYSLADLQHAMGASDEEMAMLQQLGQSSHPISESEFVYDNTALQQGAPVAFNDWDCESTDFLDLDNQHGSESTTQSKNLVCVKESSEKVPSPPKKFPGSYGEYEDVEMTCPTASCAKRYHGVTALRTHIGWTHTTKLTNAFNNPRKELLSSCMTNSVVNKSLVCFVCKEVLSTQGQLDLHVSTTHVRKKLSDLVPGTSAATQSSEGAEKLKSKMSSAFGGLLDRALNKLVNNPVPLKPMKPRTDTKKEPSAAPAISNETLKFLGHLKERRRMESIENKTFTSNLAKELRKMIDREKYEKHGLDGVNSPRSSIDSDADVSSTTTKNEPPRLYSCPLCHNSFTTATNRNRHISVHHGRTTLETDDKYKPVEPVPEVINRPATPEKKVLEAAPHKPSAKVVRKKNVKKQDSESQIDSTVPDSQCDGRSSSVAAIANNQLAKLSKAKNTAAENALFKRHNLLSDDDDLSTNCSDDNSSLKSFASKTQSSNNYSSDIDTESNASQKSLIQSYQAALKITMRKKMAKQISIQEEMAQYKMDVEEEAKRQNEAFDLLLGKDSSSENNHAVMETSGNDDIGVKSSKGVKTTVRTSEKDDTGVKNNKNSKTAKKTSGKGNSVMKSRKSAKSSTKTVESVDELVKLQAEAALKELTMASKSRRMYREVEDFQLKKKTPTDSENSLSKNQEKVLDCHPAPSRGKKIDDDSISSKKKKTPLVTDVVPSKNKKAVDMAYTSSKTKKIISGEKVPPKSKKMVVDGENVVSKAKKTVVRKSKKVISDDDSAVSKQVSKLPSATNMSMPKPTTSKLPKSFVGRKKKPTSTAPQQSSKAKKDLSTLNAGSSKPIDISADDFDSCKLTSASFCDLPELEPYSINSPNPDDDEDTAPILKPCNPIKVPTTTQNKCDNISELEQLFSDDDSDGDTKIESSARKPEEKISPEFLKSITAYRDSIKNSKDQSASSESKNNTADVYNFEDEF